MNWELIWDIVIKILVLSAVSLLTTLGGILLSKLIVKYNNSKIYKYAKTLVEAAEQKFPNEGMKMGPQKQDYVMSQLAIKFPSIRDNQYLYNIVLQCVYELNQELQTQKLKAEFESKYGEQPLSLEENSTSEITEERTTEEATLTETNKNDSVIETESTITASSVFQGSIKGSMVKKKRPSSF